MGIHTLIVQNLANAGVKAILIGEDIYHCALARVGQLFLARSKVKLELMLKDVLNISAGL